MCERKEEVHCEARGIRVWPQLTCEMDRRSSSSSMPLWWLPFMLTEGDAMLSLMLSSTADASRLTRRPCVITCSRRSKMHSAASVPTFPLSASNKKDARCENLLLGTPSTTEHCHLQATGVMLNDKDCKGVKVAQKHCSLRRLCRDFGGRPHLLICQQLHRQPARCFCRGIPPGV